jgi:hypothetical protein
MNLHEMYETGPNTLKWLNKIVKELRLKFNNRGTVDAGSKSTDQILQWLKKNGFKQSPIKKLNWLAEDRSCILTFDDTYGFISGYDL